SSTGPRQPFAADQQAEIGPPGFDRLQSEIAAIEQRQLHAAPQRGLLVRGKAPVLLESDKAVLQPGRTRPAPQIVLAGCEKSRPAGHRRPVLQSRVPQSVLFRELTD